MKRRAAALLLALWLPLTGCRALGQERLDISQLEMVHALGIDRTKSDALEVTAVSGPSGGEEGGAPTLRAARADTVTLACLGLQNGAAHALSYGHITDVLFARTAAERGIGGELDYLTGEFDLRLSIRLFLLEEGTAQEALGAVSDLTDRLDTLSRDASYGSPGFAVTTLDAETSLAENGTMLLPVVALEGESLRCTGLAWFSGDRLGGILSEEASRGAGLLLGQVQRVSVEVGEADTPTAVVAEQLKCTLSIDPERETVTASLTGGASVREVGKLDLLDEAARSRLERETEAALEAQLSAALESARESGADFLHLRHALAVRAPWDARRLAEEWEDLFPRLRYQVTADITIRRGSEVNG